MSIETRRNSDPYENPQNNSATDSSELNDTELPQSIKEAKAKKYTATHAGEVVFPGSGNREGFSKGQKLLATVLTLGGLTGAGLAAHHFSTNVETSVDQGTDEGKTPLVTQPVEVSPSVDPTNITPLETAPPTVETKEQYIASLELSAEKYPDVNSLAKAIMVDRYTAWMSQGISQEARDEYMDPNTNKTADDFAQEKVLEDADVFPKALYVENYQEIPSLATDAKESNEISSAVLARRLITWRDDTPYERSITLSDEPKLVAGSIESGEVTFTVSWVDASNAAKNRIGTEYDKDDVRPRIGTRTITTVNVNGKWKISDIKFQ